MLKTLYTYHKNILETFTKYVTHGHKTRRLSFLTFFYCITFCTASASKYLLQYQTILFLTEVRLEHLIRTIKKVKKWIKKVKIFRVIIIVLNHYVIVLKLLRVIKGFIIYPIKQTALKSGYCFITYGKFMDAS